MGVSMSFNVGTSGKSKGSLGASDKHNERKYKSNSLENTNSNINFELSKNNKILRGTRDLYKDVEKTYKEEFTKAVEDYNAKQKRNDRKIYDYFQKISDDKKTNLYTEIVVQVGDNEFWKDKNLEEKKQMVEVFNKQLEIIEKEYPNFKISNATAHFDETSPHMHIIGVCVSDRETALKNKDDKKVSKRKNGLDKYVSQSEIFTQKNLLEFHKVFDEKSLKAFNEVYKTNEVLNDKKLHQEHLDLKTFKMSAEKIKEVQKEFDDLKLKKEEVKNDIKDLEKEKSNLKNLEEEVIKKVDKIVFVSEKSLIVFTEKYKEYNNKCTYIYNGVVDILEKNKINFEEKPIKFICVGTINERKGQKLIFNTVKKLEKKLEDKVVFYIVGGGPEYSRYKNLVEKFNLEKIIKVLGEREDVEALLKQSHIFILPSYDEGLPIAIIEAMRAGLPIIATKVGGIPEMILNGREGYLINPIEDDIEDILNQVLDNKIDLEKLSYFSRQKYEEQFSLEVMIKKYAEVINE